MIKKYIVPIIVILLICILYFINNNKSNNTYSDMSIINQNIMESKNKITDTIKVHILGEVNNPGLIELDVESRVSDAIEKAGGATGSADITKVNLAYILSDGEKIYIPSFNDEYIEENSAMKTDKININSASKEEIQTLNGIGETLANSIVEYRKKNGKFNSIEDLKNVSGIGESKFEKIKDSISVK